MSHGYWPPQDESLRGAPQRPVGREQAMDYHLMFPDISMRTIEIVQDIVKVKRLWKVDTATAFHLIGNMFARFSGVYGMSTPGLHVDTYEHYLIPAEEIGLPKPSLVSACHEYRHHMQKHSRQRFGDIEVDARGWSISLFHLALPEDFDRGWRRNRIWYMPEYPPGPVSSLISPERHSKRW